MAGWSRCTRHGRQPNPDYRKRDFPEYQEARDIVQACGLRSSKEYQQARRTDLRVAGLPANPEVIYGRAGTWIDWPDYLGSTPRWTRTRLARFLQDLQPALSSLSAAELTAILREAHIWTGEGGDCPRVALARRIMALPTLRDCRAELSAIVTELSDQQEGRAARGTQTLPRVSIVASGAAEQDAPLPDLTPPTVLDGAERAVRAIERGSERVVTYLVHAAVFKLWQCVFKAGNADAAVEEVKSYRGGEYAERVRSLFLAQWHSASAICPPPGYAFHVGTQRCEPSLMQRLLAYRLKTERRVGNWSAPGAGKTLGAILASRVVESRLTVVVSANNTLDGWQREIRVAWPDSIVYKKHKGDLCTDRGKHSYLLLNYEAFQQPQAAAMVERLTTEHVVDMIVLDEVHNSKQRGALETVRRRVLGTLLARAAARNPGLYVLGMSATPVINSLEEGASLLQMILGTPQDDLKTAPTLANAIALHERLVVHGVRYQPHYAQQLRAQTVSVDGTQLAAALAGAAPRHVLPLEQALVRAKLETIVRLARPGTVVYTQYVDGIVDVLQEALERSGLSVVEFTGRSKAGLNCFKAGRADVLIGSASLREGIDGLQRRSNRLIVASLPWTHAAYEQLIGRFYRQGSAFDQVDVIVPEVVIGGAWSWDRERMARVRYKKTLADAALDGVIPEGTLESEQSMLQRSLQALRAWIADLEGTPAA